MYQKTWFMLKIIKMDGRYDAYDRYDNSYEIGKLIIITVINDAWVCLHINI